MSCDTCIAPAAASNSLPGVIPQLLLAIEQCPLLHVVLSGAYNNCRP
jgi:hypothetical protein